MHGLHSAGKERIGTMTRFTYAVLSRSLPGREEEFVAWYRDRHFGDVLRMPGVVGGKLVQLDFQRVYDLDAPQWTLLTLYELEGEEPAAIIDTIKAASGSDGMPMSDALTKAGMVQAAGHVIAESG